MDRQGTVRVGDCPCGNPDSQRDRDLDDPVLQARIAADIDPALAPRMVAGAREAQAARPKTAAELRAAVNEALRRLDERTTGLRVEILEGGGGD